MATIVSPSMARLGLDEYQKNINVTLKCRECQIEPANIVENYSEGTVLCGDCGLVIEDRVVDTRSEWRTFSNDDQNSDDPSRVGDGPNPLLGNSLTTEIQFAGGANARDLNRAQNKATQDKGTKALMAAYKDIGELCEGWQLPKNVTDTAKFLYKKVHDSGAMKGKSQEVISAGCIFIACRTCGVPRTFRETFALTKVPKKEIGKVFKQLEALFKKDNAIKEREFVDRNHAIDHAQMYQSASAEQTNAYNLLVRYASQLGLDSATSKIAQDVAQKMDREAILAGRSPLSQCAASLYFASHLMGDPKSTMEISKLLGISDGTIRTVYKVLHQSKDKLVEEKWLRPIGRGDLNSLPAV